MPSVSKSTPTIRTAPNKRSGSSSAVCASTAVGTSLRVTSGKGEGQGKVGACERGARAPRKARSTGDDAPSGGVRVAVDIALHVLVGPEVAHPQPATESGPVDTVGRRRRPAAGIRAAGCAGFRVRSPAGRASCRGSPGERARSCARATARRRHSGSASGARCETRRSQPQSARAARRPRWAAPLAARPSRRRAGRRRQPRG
eukprot:2723912-Prymnesium_polylepis.3